jgi:hypothetical protein
LQVRRRRETSPFQLSGLKDSQGGAAREEDAETPGKRDDDEGVHPAAFVIHGLLCGSAERKDSCQPRQKQQQQQQTQPAPGGGEKKEDSREKEERNEPSHPSRNKPTPPMDNMFKVITVVQQIMTGLNESVYEEGKIMAITKVVIELLNEQ